jgi:hypothetical protein
MKKKPSPSKMGSLAGNTLPADRVKNIDLCEGMRSPFDTNVHLITHALHDAMQDIQFLDKHRLRDDLSTLRYHMLLATLRTALRHARGLEKEF